ncbi:RnfABCDGE type electron transport complex subunit D [candidate division KSB1 bacterium]|nr:RnfABCDGE type electron transport complex subunit D [candidate division KSB1 bacterium]
MEYQFFVSSAPHFSDKDTVQKIMFDVVLALLPAMAAAIYYFEGAAWVILVSIAACLATEAIVQKLLKKPITISDGSALVTGILLAFNLPAGIPLWMPIIGAVFAIAIGKHAFGGLGYNPMNPALLGRAFLLASWPKEMTTFGALRDGTRASGLLPDAFSSLVEKNPTLQQFVDTITSATPLNAMKQAQDIVANSAAYVEDKVTVATLVMNKLSDLDSYSELFLGKVGGCLGETSVALLLLGALYLMYKRRIGWKIPFSYIGTVALLSWIFGGPDALLKGDALFHALSGGLILGAFFMATDMVTSPVTYWGRIIFGVGCGIITVVIRLIGGYPEGVSYSILLMNLTVPLIDKFTKPRIFGEVKAK